MACLLLDITVLTEQMENIDQKCLSAYSKVEKKQFDDDRKCHLVVMTRKCDQKVLDSPKYVEYRWLTQTKQKKRRKKKNLLLSVTVMHSNGNNNSNNTCATLF